jgi:hypothetical protein
MNEQLSFSLSDEVAPYFNSTAITALCSLIDEKQSKGLKYQDLKQQLQQLMKKIQIPNEPIIYTRTTEFVRYY